MRKQKSLPLWIVLFSLLIIVSCRKSDLETPVAETPTSIERFFNLPGSADPRLKAIAQSIRKQEKDDPFLKDFTKRAGWPVWNKAKMVGSGTGNVTGRSTSGADSTTLVYIPFVKDSAIIVNSVLAVKLEPSDTAFRILYANKYESFGFDTTVTDTWNARDVFQFFALFQYDIFGHTKFQIKDERLFNTPKDSFTVATLKERNGVEINSRMSRTTDTYTMTECLGVEVCSDPPAPTPSDQPPHEARVNLVFHCPVVTICHTFYWSGGTGWTGSGWDGAGGSSGSWGTTTSCMNTSTGTPIACSPGWVPDDNYVSNYISSITNNITDPCLNEVYNKITESAYKNKLSQMLRDFQNSDLINISLNTNNSLASNVYGRAYSPTSDDNYIIEMHTDLVRRCSQEFIASIYFHEAIHVYLKAYQSTWITKTSSEHLEMLENYFNHLVGSIRNVFPSLPEMDAYCIILSCIQNSDKDPAFDQAMFDAVKAAYLLIIQTKFPSLSSESAIQAIADLYSEGGVAGTRNPNCN